MNPEYLKLVHAERVYGEKNLLESQLNLITAKKRIIKYRKLRRKEFSYKIILKKKIQELKDALSILEKSLPSSKMEKDIDKEEIPPKKIDYPESPKPAELEQKEEPEGPSTLEREISEIKRKLAALQ